MYRSTKVLAVALVCSAGMFFSRNIAAAPVVSTFSDTTGLDLAGNFILAEDINRASGTVVVGGLTFNPETFFKTSPSFGDYSTHNWGGAVAFSDANLNTLLQTIRYSGDAHPNETSQGPMIANIPVTAGNIYKLQLIFWEGDSSREDWNITIEGDTTLSNFDLLDYTGNVISNTTGVLVTYEYTATDGFLNVSLASVTDSSATSSVMINAFTLELLPAPEPNSMCLLLLGSAGVAAARRASKRRGRFLMSRATKSAMVALVCLTGTLFPRIATAGFATPVAFDDVSDLDLSGTFILRENTAGAALASVGGVPFTAGDTKFTGGSPYSGWTDPTFADAGLVSLMDSVSLKLGTSPVHSANFTVVNGESYKLQLLFREGDPGEYNAGGRPNWTIQAGADTLSGFNVTTVMGGGTLATHTSVGALVVYEFVATGTSLAVTLTGNNVANSYVYLNGFTLEQIPAPEPTSASLFLLGCGSVVAVRRAAKRRG